VERAEKKDYEDIAAMRRAGGSLSHGLAAARLLFGKAFQPSESLKSLAYFKDGDLPRLSHNDRRTLIAAAAAFAETRYSALVLLPQREVEKVPGTFKAWRAAADR